MKQNNDYDEITFALFYDGELDREEEADFMEALDSDSALREHYESWAELGHRVHDHFEALEASYDLDRFTDQVMEGLPNVSSWTSSRSTEAIVEESSGASWWRTWMAPMMIGAVSAAAILVIAQSLTQVQSTTTRSTVLINYPEQDDKAQESPVIWLVDEEESEEDDNFDPSSGSDEDDI